VVTWENPHKQKWVNITKNVQPTQNTSPKPYNANPLTIGHVCCMYTRYRKETTEEYGNTTRGKQMNKIKRKEKKRNGGRRRRI